MGMETSAAMRREICSRFGAAGQGGRGIDRDAKWNSARGNQDCRQESGMDEINQACLDFY